MNQYEQIGSEIRQMAKTLVLHFMQSRPECQPGEEGLRLTRIFRACGFDWGDQIKATASNQQYWVSAIIRVLEAEGKVERIGESGPWRLL
ncbi:hypothetical protein [Halomonas sp.]|uniref:hypothetical protein n=1 Tax=Halomonas sp. TaxID=1486246 RepID=UPI003569DAA8